MTDSDLPAIELKQDKAMNRKDQRGEEKKMQEAVASIFPGFMRGVDFKSVDQLEQPPDFLGKDQDGQKIGLELARWLNDKQARDSKRRESMGNDLLSVLDWETHPRPENFSSVVITPRWGKKIRPCHRQFLCEEFHTAARNIDGTWEERKARHWKPLPEGSQFDYEAHEDELKCYPTLSKYISSIWFFQPREQSSSAADQSWISVISVGPDLGLYDPNVSIQIP